MENIENIENVENIETAVSKTNGSSVLSSRIQALQSSKYIKVSCCSCVP